MKIRMIICIAIVMASWGQAAQGAAARYLGKPAGHWIQRMANPAVPERIQALEALGELGPEGPGLVDAVRTGLNDRDAQVRLQAVRVLGKLAIGDRAASAALAATFSDPELVIPALQVTHDLRILSVVGPVTSLLEAKDARIRVYAAYARSVIGCRRTFQPEPVYRDVLKDSIVNEEVRLLALGLLYEGNPSREPLDVLAELVRGKNAALRAGATDVLVRHAGAATPLVTTLLKSPDPECRLCAVRVLAGAPGKDADSVLTGLLGDSDDAVRFAAVQVLAYRPTMPAQVLPVLIEAVRGKDVQRRDQAVSVLHRMGQKAASAAPALVDLLLRENHRPAERALRQVKAAPAELLRGLTHADAAVRKRFVESLRGIHPLPAEAIPTLVAMLSSADADERNEVEDILEELPAEQAALVVAKLARHDKAEIRLTSVRLLRSLDSKPEVRDALQHLLADREPSVHQAAFQVLIRDKEWAKKSVPVVLAEIDNPRSRDAAGACLAGMPEQGTVIIPKLEGMLHAEDSGVRLVAARTLLVLNPEHKGAFEAARQLAASKQPAIAISALEALPIKNPETHAFARGIVRSTHQRRVPAPAAARLAALQILASKEVTIPENFDTLVWARDNSEHDIRTVAMGYVGERGPRAAPSAKRFGMDLRDKEPAVRQAALAGLARLGDAARSEVPALKAALDDADSSICMAAASLLIKLDATANPQVIAVLCKLALSDDRFVSDQAAAGLLSMGAEARPAIPTLMKVLASGPRPLKCGRVDLTGHAFAIQALQIQGKHAVPGLIAALTDDNTYLRDGAFRVLAGMKAEARDALPALRLATEDRNPAYREMAMQAVKAIEGTTTSN